MKILTLCDTCHFGHWQGEPHQCALRVIQYNNVFIDTLDRLKTFRRIKFELKKREKPEYRPKRWALLHSQICADCGKSTNRDPLAVRCWTCARERILAKGQEYKEKKKHGK